MSSQPESPITFESMDEGIYLVQMYSEIADSCFTPVYFDGENMYSFGAPQPVMEDEVVAIISKLDMDKVHLYHKQLQSTDDLSFDAHLARLRDEVTILIGNSVEGVDGETLIHMTWEVLNKIKELKEEGCKPSETFSALPAFIPESFIADAYRMEDKRHQRKTANTPAPQGQFP